MGCSRRSQLGDRAAYANQAVRNKRLQHKHYIEGNGDDMPEVAGRRWGRKRAEAQGTSTEGDNV